MDLRTCCHGLNIAIPLCGVLGNRDDARLHVMHIVAQMLMQGKCYGSINFVCLHSF